MTSGFSFGTGLLLALVAVGGGIFLLIMAFGALSNWAKNSTLGSFFIMLALATVIVLVIAGLKR